MSPKKFSVRTAVTALALTGAFFAQALPASAAHAYNYRPEIAAPVPEASTTISFGLMLALGLGGAFLAARKKKARSEN